MKYFQMDFLFADKNETLYVHSMIRIISKNAGRWAAIQLPIWEVPVSNVTYAVSSFRDYLYALQTNGGPCPLLTPHIAIH